MTRTTETISRHGRRGLSILVTGFGAFPGAPFNPTGPVVAELLRRRRMSSARLISHVFPVSYAAVDRDLPKLIQHHRPDAVLMFGLAVRTRHLRIETRARNAITGFPDAAGTRSGIRAIMRGGPAALPFGPHGRKLLRAARSRQVPARLSRDAGTYLCNYLCWRALELTRREDGPVLAAFIHVPLVRRTPTPHARPGHGMTFGQLVRAADAILGTLIAELRAHG